MTTTVVRPATKRDSDRLRYQRIMADPVLAEQRRTYEREARRRTREWLYEYKMTSGCVDCGYAVHFAALQLDHNGPKTATISELRGSKKRMLTEIENGRCEVRCANCHAVKTWAEKNGIEYEPGMSPVTSREADRDE